MIEIIFFASYILGIFQLPYNLYIQVTFSIILGILLILNLIYKKYELTDLLKPSILFFGLWFLLSLVSYWWSLDKEGWLIYTLILFVVFILNNVIALKVSDSTFLNKFFIIQLISNIIHSFIGWFEVFTGRYIFFALEETVNAARILRNPISLFTNTNDFAFYLFFSSILLMFWKFTPQKKIRITLLLSNLGLIYLSDSRGMYIALIITSVCLIYFKLKNRHLKFILGLIIIFSMLFSLIIIIGYNIDILNVENISNNIRVNLIKNGLQYVLDSPFVGIGSGNGPFYLQSFPYFNIYGQTQFHNWWIEILTQYGIPFFVVYCLYYFYMLTKSFGKALENGNLLARICFVWLLTFIIASISSSTIFPRIWVWIVTSIIYNLVNLRNDKIKLY